MTRDPLQQRVDELFLAAIEQPASERVAFLEQAARNDRDLIRRVMELLEADERAGTRFAGRGPLNLQDLTVKDVGDPRIGQTLDDYVIEASIASGGFGTVYRAGRTEPYVEHVAIKLLHRDYLAAPAIVKWAISEMQALSDLRHPHIVSQLYANLSPAGEPYIVMEYIDGVSLDTYCDVNQLSIKARLQLFQKVCEAVEFAHRHGWVHRDLKPGNILVTKDGTPKLLDFGIAKLIGPGPSQGQTRTRDIVGTPEYMSPEQFTGREIGPTTDVYALGSILYELISGQRVFDVICHGVDVALLDAIQSAVHETIPRRPSTLVEAEFPTRAETKENVAALRDSNPSALRRSLEGDVDNIVMMALRKEPERRYPTAEAISRDIQRWLDHRPVVARPDSLAYRAKKFARRNRAVIAMTMLITSCLVMAALALQTGRKAITRSDTERALRHIESAQQFLESDMHQTIAHLHAAHDATPRDPETRGAVERMLAGYCRYLGVPLGPRANIRHAFRPDGRLLAVARPDTIDVWDTERQQQRCSFPTDAKRIARFSWHAEQLLAVANDTEAICWDVAAAKETARQKLGPDIVTCRLESGVAFFLQVSGEEVRLRRWDLLTNRIRDLASRKITGELVQAEFVGDSHLAVMLKAEGRKQVVLWDGKSLELKRAITEPQERLRRWRISQAHGLVAQPCWLGSRPASFLIDTHNVDRQERVSGEVVDIDPTGSLLLIKEARRLRMASRNEKNMIGDSWELPHDGQWDAAFTRHNRPCVAHVLTENARRQTSVTTLGNSTQRTVLRHPFFSRDDHAYDRAEFGPLGRHLVFDARSDSGTARTRVPWMWKLEPFRAHGSDLVLPNQPRHIGIAGHWLVTATDNELTCHNLHNGSMTRTKRPSVTALGVANDTPLAAIGDDTGLIHYVELPSLQLIRTIRVSTHHAIRSVAMTFDGKHTLVATPTELSVWANEAPLHAEAVPRRVTVVEQRDAPFSRARFSDTEHEFAVASGHALHGHDLMGGFRKQFPINLDQYGHVLDFAVMHGQARVVTIHDGVIYLLDTARTLTPVGARDARCAVLRGDGLVLAIGFANGNVQFFDTVTRRSLTKPLNAGTGAISHLAFSSDGARLASISEEGQVHVWWSRFELPVDATLLRPYLETLTGRLLEPSKVNELHYLDQSSWLTRYDQLEHAN